MILGGLLNWLQISVPEFILIPIDLLSNAFLAIALILLGTQLTQIQIKTMFNKMVNMKIYIVISWAAPPGEVKIILFVLGT